MPTAEAVIRSACSHVGFGATRINILCDDGLYIDGAPAHNLSLLEQQTVCYGCQEAPQETQFIGNITLGKPAVPFSSGRVRNQWGVLRPLFTLTRREGVYGLMYDSGDLPLAAIYSGTGIEWTRLRAAEPAPTDPVVLAYGLHTLINTPRGRIGAWLCDGQVLFSMYGLWFSTNGTSLMLTAVPVGAKMRAII